MTSTGPNKYSSIRKPVYTTSVGHSLKLVGSDKVREEVIPYNLFYRQIDSNVLFFTTNRPNWTIVHTVIGPIEGAGRQ